MKDCLRDYFLISRGNSIGLYSDFIPSNYFPTIEEANDWGMDNYYGDFVVWHWEWDEDRSEYVAVSD